MKKGEVKQGLIQKYLDSEWRSQSECSIFDRLLERLALAAFLLLLLLLFLFCSVCSLISLKSLSQKILLFSFQAVEDQLKKK